MILFKFIIASGVIFFCGSKLIKYADTLSVKWNLSQHVMGFIILAIITAFPELCASSSSAYIGNADLALGNLFGSNAFNIFIIVILDIINKGRPIVLQADKNSLYIARLGIILISIAVFAIALNNGAAPFYLQVFSRFKIYHLSLFSVIIFLVYIFGSKKNLGFTPAEKNTGKIMSFVNSAGKEKNEKFILAKFLICAVIIILSGIYISQLANQISKISIKGTVLGGTLIGTFLLAIATSLPELAVTASAVKRGLYGMALGNILGSNMINMSNIFWADIFYRPGPIFNSVSSLHMFTGALTVVLTLIVAAGIAKPIQKSFLKLNLRAWLLLITYLGGFCFIFKFR